MVRADFKERAAIWMLDHVLVRIRMSAATPSGPGIDLLLVLRSAASKAIARNAARVFVPEEETQSRTHYTCQR